MQPPRNNNLSPWLQCKHSSSQNVQSGIRCRRFPLDTGNNKPNSRAK